MSLDISQGFGGIRKEKAWDFFGSDKNPRAELAVLFAKEDEPMEAAIDWARSVADKAGLDSAKDEVQLIRELRRTELNLDLKTATYLAEQTAKAAR